MSNGTILYSSPPMVIGDHRWRAEVCGHATQGAHLHYQYEVSPGCWYDEQQWPDYDPDNSYGGLPCALSELYLAYVREIVAALAYGVECWLQNHADDHPYTMWVGFLRESLREYREQLDAEWEAT